MSIKTNKKILFVGSFKSQGRDGSVGGQMFACRSLINSELSKWISWTLIDSTADSNVVNSFYTRATKAIKRILLFIQKIIFKRYDYILIFTADGWSFWEKGLMVLLGRLMSKAQIILAPRSGIILEDIKKGGILSKYIPFVIKYCNIIICQSISWKKYFENLVNENNSDKFVVIENWIDIKPYIRLEISKVDLVQQPTQILFLSWVDKNKGIYELIEAVRLLKQDGLIFKLMIAGKGSAFTTISEQIIKYDLQDYVTLYGWAIDDDKIKLLENSNIYVLPSYFEGFPNALMEAMAAGKACIATRVGSIPDMISDGLTGLLIESRSVIDLYEKLKKLIENNQLQIDMGKAARKKIMENNTIEQSIEKFHTILL